MSVMWRARDVPRAERIYYMRDAAATAIVPMDLFYEDKEQDFDGWIRAVDLGPVRVVHTSAPRGAVGRTPKLIRSSDPELCWLLLQLRERNVLEQGDRQAALGAGDFAFADLSRPCRVAGSMLESVHVVIPRALLPLRDRQISELAGSGFPGRRADGALVSTLMRQVVTDLDAYEGQGGVRVGGAVLDLIIAALSARVGREVAVPPESHRRTLLVRIHAFIEERLGAPDLSPPAIAAAHHISTRYLHRLFESEGQSVSSWVRSRRLERCRRDLLNPELVERPVSAIARRWGFFHPAHFSRVFRDVYGVTPTEYRRLGT